MKLQCQVEVVNRSHSILNIGPKGKYLKSTLAIGKEAKCQTEYFIIHFSTANKSGIKYRVKTIKQVFVKCLNEGKATIRFDNPPHDLCIKSETIQLKCFMNLLKSCIGGHTKDLRVSSLCNLSVTVKDNAPKKLIIRNRSEYPTNGLPRTLETLYITGLKLSNFRREILLLKQLVVLDLSNNDIEKLPPEFGRMQSLRELHLANNLLGVRGEVDWKWLFGAQITKTLKLLDLSGNRLVELPKEIWKLQKLVTLKLDDNMFDKLPSTIGRISSLRYLTITQNELDTLPCSLMQCRLEYIDISSNKFCSKNELTTNNEHSKWNLYIGNLVHIAAKIVLKNKFYYAPNIIPRTLVDFLNNANMCVCGAPVVNDLYCITREHELRDYFSTVVSNNDCYSVVDFECYFCSPKCYSKIIRKGVNMEF